MSHIRLTTDQDTIDGERDTIVTGAAEDTVRCRTTTDGSGIVGKGIIQITLDGGLQLGDAVGDVLLHGHGFRRRRDRITVPTDGSPSGSLHPICSGIRIRGGFLGNRGLPQARVAIIGQLGGIGDIVIFDRHLRHGRAAVLIGELSGCLVELKDGTAVGDTEG